MGHSAGVRELPGGGKTHTSGDQRVRTQAFHVSNKGERQAGGRRDWVFLFVLHIKVTGFLANLDSNTDSVSS